MRAAFVIAIGVLVGGLATAGCGGSPHAAAPPSAAATTVAPPGTTAVASPPATTADAPAPGTTAAASAPATTAVASPTSGTLPISVQSDTQMQSAGNDGPSSSILAPTSCVLVGGILTAAGGYTNGGFAPNVYNRYGDVVQLYAYTTAAGRVQVAELASERRPPIGGYGTWRVSASINDSLGTPSVCVVAAQPTHPVQLAP